MTARFRFICVFMACLALMCGSGCTASFWDPPQLGRFRPTPAVNVILKSLGVAEEPPMAWEDGEPPRPEDAVPLDSDYTLGVGDMVTVSIFELLEEGQWMSSPYEVKGTGQIFIPEVGDVMASGLTETQLQNKIKAVLSPDVIAEPIVSVALQNSQRRTCSVMGEGVAMAGTQLITRNDFRLFDALAGARGLYQANVSFVYVTRRAQDDDLVDSLQSPGAGQDLPLNELSVLGPEPQAHQYVPPSRPPMPVQTQPMASQSVVAMSNYDTSVYTQPFNQEREILGMATPSMKRLWQESERVKGSSFTRYPYGSQGQVISAAEFQPAGTTQDSAFNFGQDPATTTPQNAPGPIDWEFQNGKWVPVQRPGAAPVIPTQPQPQITQPVAPRQVVPQTTDGSVPVDWVFENGKWIAVPMGGQPQNTIPNQQFQQNQNVIPLDMPSIQSPPQIARSQGSRLIRIPADRVVAGDPRYNIVIRPGDTIYVPRDVAGYFTIGGQVNGTGRVPLSGPTTLKEAIFLAGGLGALAYPKKCEVVRRIGENREEVVMVDLEKIGKGEQPDFFVKPHDLINVGTHFTSRWRAVLRNAFRAAYGFGFVYDRNFGDSAYGRGFGF
ncbi:MAG: polysaccharide biosynthesis/export family protein [Phycisphaeraceae bacterium]|nr:polysaccharide biosynthesis/export family protein [Phycisphaeraceae bacterium]